MMDSQEAFSQFLLTLINKFDCVYYVNADTDNYINLTPIKIFESLGFPFYGENFYTEAIKHIQKCVHPDDLGIIKKLFNKKLIIKRLENKDFHTEVYRLIIDNKITHMRHTEFLTLDKSNIIICMENIEKAFQEKEAQKKSLESAERMARFDQLTGVRNKNAFQEYSEIINKKIKKQKGFQFAVTLCDMNNLKLINDTQGHSFGDESIQRTSRMICNNFKHSPVFRIGGDEFVIIIDSQDYNKRDELLKALRDESQVNKLSRSGPVVASGMAVYDPKVDDSFSEVFKRADMLMYKNKQELKKFTQYQSYSNLVSVEEEITPERKRALDKLFDALYTVSGGGYLYLNDMRYDFSRWSLPLVDDFDMDSEYMYHADKYWQEHIHPDDMQAYKEVIKEIFASPSAEMRPLTYRSRRGDGTYAVLSTRGFVLTDVDGRPEYFGGIIIPH